MNLTLSPALGGKSRAFGTRECYNQQERTAMSRKLYTYPTRSRTRRTFIAQGNDLATKAAVDFGVALGARMATNYVCSRPNPDYILCRTFDNVANQEAEKFKNSALAFGVWGGVALLAALLGEL